MGSALALPNRSRRLVQQRKRAATDVSAFASGWRRHVRVFANISSVTGFLPEALASFLRDHPDIEVSLEDRITSDILHAIRTGAADIGSFSRRSRRRTCNSLHGERTGWWR